MVLALVASAVPLARAQSGATLVQDGTETFTSGFATSSTFTVSGYTKGNLLVVAFMSGKPITSLTDDSGTGTTWTEAVANGGQAQEFCYDTDVLYCASNLDVWYAVAAATASGSVTLTPTASDATPYASTGLLVFESWSGATETLQYVQVSDGINNCLSTVSCSTTTNTLTISGQSLVLGFAMLAAYGGTYSSIGWTGTYTYVTDNAIQGGSDGTTVGFLGAFSGNIVSNAGLSQFFNCTANCPYMENQPYGNGGWAFVALDFSSVPVISSCPTGSQVVGSGCLSYVGGYEKGAKNTTLTADDVYFYSVQATNAGLLVINFTANVAKANLHGGGASTAYLLLALYQSPVSPVSALNVAGLVPSGGQIFPLANQTENVKLSWNPSVMIQGGYTYLVAIQASRSGVEIYNSTVSNPMYVSAQSNFPSTAVGTNSQFTPPLNFWALTAANISNSTCTANSPCTNTSGTVTNTVTVYCTSGAGVCSGGQNSFTGILLEVFIFFGLLPFIMTIVLGKLAGGFGALAGLLTGGTLGVIGAEIAGLFTGVQYIILIGVVDIVVLLMLLRSGGSGGGG